MPEDKHPFAPVDGLTDAWSAGPEEMPSRGESSETKALPAGAPGSAEPPAVPPELRQHARYQVLALLGQGGMGAVYKARHLHMDRLVALKIIRPALVTRPASLERFKLEVRAAARLAHPNIVTAHDADQAGEMHFLVMEFVEGQSLDQYLRQRGPLPVAEACDYVRQAALGLQHAHGKGMVHRDVKPHNLMRTASGEIKILDFGLARLGQAGPTEEGTLAVPLPDGTAAEHLTGVGAMMGTVDYIAPEQAADAHSADIRADIYSLGCTLYQLLTGRVVFPGGSLRDKLIRHQKAMPVPLLHRRSDVPPSLASIVQRMLAKDPDQRYQTPGEVAEALAGFTTEAVPVALPVAQAAAENEARASVFADLTDVDLMTGKPSQPPRWTRWPARLIALVFGLAIVSVLTMAYVLPRRASRNARPAAPPSKTEKPAPTNRAALQLSHGREVQLLGHTGIINRIAIGAGGRLAISGGADRVPRIWDLTTGKLVKSLEAHPDIIWCVALSSDGRYAATGGQHKAAERGELARHDVLRLWDVESGKLVSKLVGHAEVVHQVAFTADSRRLVSSNWDHTARLWDVSGRKPPRTFSFGTPALATAFLPGDDELLVGTADGMIRVLDLNTAEERAQFRGPGDEYLAVSPDGQSLLACGFKGPADGQLANTILLHDLATRRQRRLLGHTDTVLSVAFSPDGRRAVSAGRDATVRVWDVEGGRVLYCDRGHRGEVRSAVFTADGRYILSAGQDGVVRLWPVPPDLGE